MRIVQFSTDGSTGPKASTARVGVELSNGGDICDVTAVDSSIPSDMLSFLEAGQDSLDKAKAAVETKTNIIPRASVTLLAPIYNPEKLICIGMNYKEHCTEQDFPIPTEPVVFSKFASAITEPNADVILTPEVSKLDFEVELAIVIGKSCKRVKAEDAMQYVAGYTVAHDVSARCWQLEKNGGQWLVGKTMDSYAPIGPAIVTVDEVGDPHKLGIRCRLNGETVQNSNTDELVFDTGAILEWVTKFVTLKAGDLIFTGTPSGVGCFRKPPLWLKAGDKVECEIDNIGCITNNVVAESDAPAIKKVRME